MSYETFVILPSFVLVLITIRTWCSILVFQSQPAFVLIFLAVFVLDCMCVTLDAPALPRTLLINPLAHIVLPLVCSTGPLRERAIRVGIAWLLNPVAEFSGLAMLMLLGNNPFFEQADASNAIDLAITYTVTIALYALASQLVVAFFRRRSTQRSYEMKSPLVPFLLIIPLSVYYPLTVINQRRPFQSLFLIFACYAVSALYAYLALGLFNEDLRTRREAVNAAATIRQERHVRIRINHAARRGADLRRLRHDLANQVEVVGELAGKGYAQEADRYLADLQARAATLTGGGHA